PGSRSRGAGRAPGRRWRARRAGAPVRRRIAASARSRGHRRRAPASGAGASVLPASAHPARYPAAVMRVLVLGGDGYLGWPTALRFSDRGHEVAVLDNFSRRRWHLQQSTESLIPILTLE